jgi:hypothetical protein
MVKCKPKFVSPTNVLKLGRILKENMNAMMFCFALRNIVWILKDLSVVFVQDTQCTHITKTQTHKGKDLHWEGLMTGIIRMTRFIPF